MTALHNAFKGNRLLQKDDLTSSQNVARSPAKAHVIHSQNVDLIPCLATETVACMPDTHDHDVLVLLPA